MQFQVAVTFNLLFWCGSRYSYDCWNISQLSSSEQVFPASSPSEEHMMLLPQQENFLGEMLLLWCAFNYNIPIHDKPVWLTEHISQYGSWV